MTNTYFINDDETIITVEVIISTPGFSISRIDKEIPESSTEDIADSPDDGIGDIPQTDIGQANIINGCTIETDTIIELQNIISEEQWQACFDNLVCQYIFTGGSDGTQIFNCDADDKKRSASGGIITVAKMIILTTNKPLP